MAQRVEFILDVNNAKLKTNSDKATKSVKGLDKATRKTTQSTDKMTSAWKKFQKVIVGAAIFEVVRRGFQRMIRLGSEFQQSLADLEAITGITGSALQQLGEDAISTSNEYGTAAARVVEAQKLVASQLAEKIDFGTAEGVRELSEIADAATLLSKAAGTELEPAVSTLTTAINQFNLPASEANRIVNAMAAGAKLGAAELADQGEAIRDSGTSANAANVSFEQLNASIQTLAANGLRGAQAGVGLRNVFVRLETQSKKLADAGYEVNLQQDGLFETLRKLEPLTRDVTTRTEIFGERAQAVAQILIENADSAEKLTGQITGTDTAQEQATIQMNTFRGSVERLTAAFDNQLINSFQQTNGLMVKMVNSLTWLIEEFSGGLSIINGWVDGHQDLRKEMMLQETRSRELSKAVQQNIADAKAALEAGGLEADKRKELTDFIDQQQKSLDDLGDTYRENGDTLQQQRKALLAEIEALDDGVFAGKAARFELKERRKELEALDIQIQSNQNRLDAYNTLVADSAEVTEDATEDDEDQTEAKKNLAAQIEANEEQIGKLITQSGDLSDAQMNEILQLMAQNEAIEEQIRLREEMAQKKFAGESEDDEITAPDMDAEIMEVDTQFDTEKLQQGSDIIDQMNQRIDRFVTISKVLGETQNDVGFAIQQTIRSIEDLIDAGYDPTSDAVQDLVEQYDKLTRAQQAQNTFMQVMVSSQIESMRDLGNVIIQETARAIKARIAEAVATQIGNVLASVPFPFNIAAAAAAAGAVNLLFNNLIPEFEQGGIVTGGGMASGMTTSGQKLISINEDARPEFIVNADSTQAALPLLEAINDDANFARQIIGGFKGGGKVGGDGASADAIADAVVRGMRTANLVARVEFTEFDDQYNDFKDFQKRIGNTD